MPSTFPEAFGMVAVEAAACGALPVSADHSGMREVSRQLAAALPPEVGRLTSFPVEVGAVEAIAERLGALAGVARGASCGGPRDAGPDHSRSLELGGGGARSHRRLRGLEASRRRFNRMPARLMYGRLPIVKMLAVTVAMTAAISAVMLSINWDGQEASTAAPKIDDLLNVMIVLSAFVFSLVIVMLFYALYKFRAKPGDESDGEPIHGNTRLEIAWTRDPDDHRPLRRRLQLVRPQRNRSARQEPADRRRLLPAVRLELRLPGQGRRLLAGRTARPGQPPDPVQDALPRT